MNELHEKLSPWLDKLPFHWDSIKEYGKIRHLPKGEYLFHQGDESNKVYIVESGRIRLFLITMDGKEKTITVIGKNGLVGDQLRSIPSFYYASAITVSDSILIEMDKKVFEQHVLQDTEMTKQWLELLSIKSEILTNSLLHVSYESSLRRIINALVQLANSYGIETQNGSIKISIPFTHQELSELIGTSRVTVSNSIALLQEANLVYKKNKFYHITNIAKLKEFRSEGI
ncbi:MAG: Crp/Fnr family transcriptional regulator [Oceanobacillus sp.]|nr:Crp/Fnr family transcriptional regulator [Oceanobacillus sp.]PAE28393.1 hypothetical protein CHI07_13845 [Paenibacillus sp. 7884-2]